MATKTKKGTKKLRKSKALPSVKTLKGTNIGNIGRSMNCGSAACVVG